MSSTLSMLISLVYLLADKIRWGICLFKRLVLVVGMSNKERVCHDNNNCINEYNVKKLSHVQQKRHFVIQV
jgi:hypothetical protein